MRHYHVEEEIAAAVGVTALHTSVANALTDLTLPRHPQPLLGHPQDFEQPAEQLVYDLRNGKSNELAYGVLYVSEMVQ